jgi:hypothetical protein
MRTFLLGFVLPVGVILVAVQFVPHGRNHTNPPVRQV